MGVLKNVIKKERIKSYLLIFTSIITVISGMIAIVTYWDNAENNIILRNQQAEVAYQNKDYSQAYKLFHINAKKNNEEAQYKVGWMYDQGEGVEENDSLAIYWYQKSAAKGHTKAMRNLAFHYLQEIKPQYRNEALRLLTQAAKLGDEIAAFDLALIYDEGKVNEENDFLALKWYQKSAEMGYVPAMTNLGFLYYDQEKWLEAKKWLHKASELGDHSAQYKLGYMYYYGQGIEENKEIAKELFTKAAQKGNEQAIKALEVIGD